MQLLSYVQKHLKLMEHNKLHILGLLAKTWLGFIEVQIEFMNHNHYYVLVW